MKRRDFLKSTSQIGLAAYLSGLINHRAMAQVSGSSLKNLVYIHLELGWDVTLAIDPQIKQLKVSDTALFLGYRPEEIISAENLKFGPAATALRTLARNMVVVNGVSMLGNVSHSDCARWAQTGILERRTAGMPAMHANQFAIRGELATVLTDNSIEDGMLNISTMSQQNVANLASDQLLSTFLEPDFIVAQAKAIEAKYGSEMKSRREAQPELDQLLKSDADDKKSAAATALSFQTGFARSVLWRINPSTFTLDTHSNHQAQHTVALKSCFDQVLGLIKVLQSVQGREIGKSLFEETLVVVSSDFSREINLNGSSTETSGKEHNGYTNSYIFLSGGLQGGYSIGESVIQANVLNRPAAHVARNFDFRSGQVIRRREDAPSVLDGSGIKQIRPGHVVRTVAGLMGFESLLDPVLAELPGLNIKV
jgi:uncharacterized protein (DUF1501 family)